jgi:kynurenine/2-aminoadipate aminotransferase
MDTDDRVVRLDSFSKIISAGMRLGILTGPRKLVERIIMHEQVTSMHAPVILQIMLHKMFTHWTWPDFDAHVAGIRDFYRTQKDYMVQACEKYLTDLADWEEPRGGMFIWVKIRQVKDTWQMAMDRAVKRGILVLPGVACSPYVEKASPYVRLSYSLVSPDVMDKVNN